MDVAESLNTGAVETQPNRSRRCLLISATYTRTMTDLLEISRASKTHGFMKVAEKIKMLLWKRLNLNDGVPVMISWVVVARVPWSSERTHTIGECSMIFSFQEA